MLSLGILAIIGGGAWLSRTLWQEERGCQSYAHYAPQATPEATLMLELDMLMRGEYCYDLPIFDEFWRQQGSFETGEHFQKTAARFSVASETYIDGNRAIVYYPGSRDAGPDFLFRTESGWIIDRTIGQQSVIYNARGTDWYVNESAGEYLPLVEAVYSQND